jgi:histone deacetylase complex regulatory component SIN3
MAPRVPTRTPQSSSPPVTPRSAVVVRDALDFFAQVKKECSPETVKQFVKLMEDFSQQKLDDQQLTERVTRLFSQFPNLIRGFIKFLPGKSCDAVAYVDKVKSELGGQPAEYTQFLEIFSSKDLQVRPDRLIEAVERLAILFIGRRHLMEGFLDFCPAGFRVDYDYETTSEQKCIIRIYTPDGPGNTIIQEMNDRFYKVAPGTKENPELVEP